MIRITEKPDEVIIRETPFAKWLFSLIAATFLSLFVLAILARTGISNMAWGFGALAFIIAIFWAQPINSVTTIKINRPGKTVAVRKRSLIKYSFNVYSFDEIANFIYIDTGGVTNYQLVMPLNDGRKIKLSATGGSNDYEYFGAVDKMNLYIFGRTKEIPFNLTYNP